MSIIQTTVARREIILLAVAGLPSLSGCVNGVFSDGKEPPQIMLSNYSGTPVTVRVTLETSGEIVHEIESELQEGQSKIYRELVDGDLDYSVTAKANGMRSSRIWNPGEGLLEIDVHENEIEFGVSIS